ncbi:hypothetical protein L7F22_052329 [Adiantum nelumboides]|nr:hypothetical protein [Adiantum nelumboides]
MAGNNKENRMSIDNFDFAHEDARDDTPMLVDYLVTRLQQATGNPALQGKVQQQLHAYGILPPPQQERDPEKCHGETPRQVKKQIDKHLKYLFLMLKEPQHLATDMEVEPLQLPESTECLPPEEERVHGSPRSPRELWRKVKQKYHLVEFHALPDYLRDNEFILAHYRANWPLKQTLWSIFTIHNETLNIWTHLIGFVIFLCLTIYTFMKLPAVVPMPAMPGLPYLPNMSNLQKIPKDILSSISASLPHLHVPEMIANALPEGLNLHIPEVLSNCLPEALLSANRTNQCVLVDVSCGDAPIKPISAWCG